MKDYIIETLQVAKGNSYKIFKKNVELMDMLNKKYPNVTDIITKVQLYINGMNCIPVCKSATCQNTILFKKGKFSDFCSIKCFSNYQHQNGLYEIRSEKVKKTNLEKYGVDNYAKSNEFKEKSKKTNLEKYGVDHHSKTEEFKEKTKQTNLEKYGVKNPMQVDEFKIKAKQTNLERYGTESYSQTDDFKEKYIQTNLKKYGVEYYTQTDEYKEKTKQTTLEKYGVDHHSKTDDFREKIKKTNVEKYGTESYTQTDEYKEKTKQTNLEKYGVDHHSKTDDFREKIKKTNMERYGTESYSQTDEYKEKTKHTNLEKYGVKNPMQVDEFKIKAILTNLERYGIESYSQTEEFKIKALQTNLEKYGVENYGRINYNPEYTNITDHPDKFKELLYEHGTYGLANLVNCDPTTIYKYASDNNIPLPPRPNSYQEEIIHKFLENNNIPHTMNTKRILPSGLELDFYFPEHNLAIEMNGLYWHSEISGGKSRSYHYNKWKECNDLGITLLSINEDEFYEKQQFWFNKILYMTGKLSLTKLHARKCKVVELDNVSDFLNEHHLQGSNASKYKFGLTYENQLVSVMTFSKPRGNKIGTIDLSRFCNHSGYMVSGGASKLLNHFVKTYGHLYKEIISFSDNNYSNGNVYRSLGFSLDKNLPPDYKYIIKGKTYHKAGFRKSAIFRKHDIPSDMMNSPEWELMQYLGYDRIWDTGKKKWIMKI